MKKIDLTEVDFDVLMDDLMLVEIDAGLASDISFEEYEKLMDQRDEIIKRAKARRKRQ